MATDIRTAASREPALVRLLGAVMSLTNVLATTWILLLMVLIVADVVGRNAFLSPIAGVPEMVKYSIVGIVFLQVAHTHWKGQMIRSDGLLSVVAARRPRLAAGFDLVAQLIGAGFTVALAWAVWPKMIRAFERGEMEGVSGHFTMPVWPFLAIIVLGSALLALSFLLSAGIAARRLSARPE
ncbi:TRAP-type mannitol/chloroaromatic compound transport system permease small subunit [Amorphus suaedae]